MTSNRSHAQLRAPEKMKRNPPGEEITQRDETKNDLNNITNINGNNKNQQIEETNASRNINAIVMTRDGNNKNKRKRTKWTREMNENVVRCYFNAIQAVPNQPFRKEMYKNWKSIYPETEFTEQRISDQKREIFKKAESNQNIRGNWLTRIEIDVIQQQTETVIDRIETGNVDDEIPANNDTQAEENMQGDVYILENEIHENGNSELTGEFQGEQFQLLDSVMNCYAETILTPFENRYNFRKPGKKVEKKLKILIDKVNKTLEDNAVLTNISDVNHLDAFVYACALTAIRSAGLEKHCLSIQNEQKLKKKNDWQLNMRRRIDHLRGDISKINQIQIANPSEKIKRNNTKIKYKYDIRTEGDRMKTLETMKQRLKALNNRHQRFVKRQKQYQQNFDFENNPSKFYDELRGNKIDVKDPPSKEDVVNFWKPMFNNEKHYNKKSTWIKEYERSVQHIQEAEYSHIQQDEIKNATAKFHNWKSPGLDKLQNFWWANLPNLHTKIATILDNILRNPNGCPPWLTTGRTTLVPKKAETRDPSNYRPICCLPTIYKILTSIITTRMKTHIEANNIIPEEQKGCTSNSYGTIDQLIVNKMIMMDAINKSRNISTAWIDYRKAFDSIPHDWLIKTLTMHKFDTITVRFFEETMKNWRTSIHLNLAENSISTNAFKISTGIFQGDSPSGLHFILCLLPLSWMLKQSNLGYQPSFMNEKKNHLLFMDDLKIYAANDQQLISLINLVKIFSDDIGMNFGIGKCNKMTILKGNVKPSKNIKLENGEEIKSLDNQQYYKYLGFNENKAIERTTKNMLQQEYFTRIKKIMKSELNSKNTINAINAYAVPSLSYGFQIIDWSITELESIDTSTRVMLQKHHMQHKQGDVTRLYVPRSHGGRGLINIKNLYKSTIIKFGRYLQTTKATNVIHVSNWQHTRGDKSIHYKASVYCREMDINYEQLQQKTKESVKNTIKTKQIDLLVRELRQKQTHGQFFRNMDQPHIDKTSSNLWLKSSTLKRVTEASICAIQEQAVTTRYIQHHVHGTSDTDICRVCKQQKETVHHIVAGCPVMAPTKYLNRHNDLAKYVHSLLLVKHEVIDEIPPWYQYNPLDVIENNKVKVLWDFPIQTDHEVRHHKPDIVVVHKETRTATIIDIAVPNDTNIATTRMEKIRRYIDLAVEIKTLWELRKVDVVPIVIGATGMIHNGFNEDLQKIGIHHEFDKRLAQKIVLLATARIVRGFLQIA